MTIEAWLDARDPAPPPSLAARVRELAAAVPAPHDDPAQVCLTAAESGLARLHFQIFPATLRSTAFV